MTYELWDTQHRNIIGAYATESEALEVVRAAARINGAAYVVTLAFVTEDTDGALAPLATGGDLIARAGIQAA
jgi:hypothetical protein